MKKALSLVILCLSFHLVDAQILNGDFENWYTDSLGHHRLENWQHFDFNQVNNNFQATWEVDSAAHGLHALELSRWYSYRSDWVMQKTSIASKPYRLTGYYKYIKNQLLSPYDIDTAVVGIWLTVWNGITMQCDTIGIGKSLLSVNSGYTFFSCPVSYSDTRIPDSITIIIRPSVWIDNAVFCKDASVCSFLTIDNLWLSDQSDVKYLEESNVQIYPNPVQNKLFIKQGNAGEIKKVSVENLFAQTVFESNLPPQCFEIDASLWAPGIYFIRLIDRNNALRILKLIK